MIRFEIEGEPDKSAEELRNEIIGDDADEFENLVVSVIELEDESEAS
jgi:hypothetical protein